MSVVGGIVLLRSTGHGRVDSSHHRSSSCFWFRFGRNSSCSRSTGVVANSVIVIGVVIGFVIVLRV